MDLVTCRYPRGPTDSAEEPIYPPEGSAHPSWQGIRTWNNFFDIFEAYNTPLATATAQGVQPEVRSHQASSCGFAQQTKRPSLTRWCCNARSLQSVPHSPGIGVSKNGQAYPPGSDHAVGDTVADEPSPQVPFLFQNAKIQAEQAFPSCFGAGPSGTAIDRNTMRPTASSHPYRNTSKALQNRQDKCNTIKKEHRDTKSICTRPQVKFILAFGPGSRERRLRLNVYLPPMLFWWNIIKV